LPRIQQVIDTLEAECAELRERLAWLEAQLTQFQARQQEAAAEVPARSLRRATARRASRRRAVARSRQLDTKARIIGFLTEHPGSTAGEVAKGLDLNRASVSNRLSALAKLGEIRKAERGYAAK
jgi:predicted transcriptional regulator